MSARLAVVCCSEAEPSLVDRFIGEGRMPALHALTARGASGRTVYRAPWLLTPQLWATIMTGASAADHGVFDYWQRDARGRFRETSAADLAVEPCWSHWSRAGITCGLVHVPLTYPAGPGPAFVVAGQDAPAYHRFAVWPRPLYDELTARFGTAHVKDTFPAGHTKAEYATRLFAAASRQGDVIAHLAATREWDVFVCHLSVVAMAQHYYWADMEHGDGAYASVVPAAYAHADALIARLAGIVGEGTNVIVMSESGAGPLRAGVRVNALLAEHGFLRFAPSGDRTRHARRALERSAARARRALPARARYLLTASGAKRAVHSYLSGAPIDWANTAAFHHGKGEGNIYVNLRGRDRHGAVAPEHYDDVRDALIRSLRDVRDPATGDRAIAAVHRREDLFDGPFAERAPDLVIEWAGMAYMPDERAESGEPGSVFGERRREYMSWPTTGSHRNGGLLVAAGPSFTPGDALGDVELGSLAGWWSSLVSAADCVWSDAAL